MKKQLLDSLSSQLEELKQQGLFKEERIIQSQQGPVVKLKDGREVINLCANNYLGLSNHRDLIDAAKNALDRYGFGMSSVRFICGTQAIHRQLEEKLNAFLGTEETILYSSCFDANGGLFETLFSEEDVIISDRLNHASIIDGTRLCKAKCLRFLNNDMDDLERQLKKTQDCRYRIICTDGVFSMDGIIANLQKICSLAECYDAFVMVDDSHAVGVVGATGRGTPEYCGVQGKIDLLTGTFGKALGGASGGYISGRKQMIDWLRQRSRPYLFSNTLAPVITATTLRVLDMLETSSDLLKKLNNNSQYFRNSLQRAGFQLIPGQHPIIPIMLGDAKLATTMARLLLDEKVYVIGFSYPVVPEGKARIRVQISAAHELAQLENAVAAFIKVGKQLHIIK